MQEVEERIEKVFKLIKEKPVHPFSTKCLMATYRILMNIWVMIF